jgi:hypothetical protein
VEALWLFRGRRCWEAAVPGRCYGRPVGPRPVFIQPTLGVPHGRAACPQLFLVLALLAARFGRDSRVHLASTEEAFARQGFTWPGDQS